MRLTWKVFSLLFAVLFLLSFGPTATLYGQTSLGGGSVVGAVTDASGAAVPNAEVVLTDPSTKVALTTKSNGAGLYAFREVRPGVYSLKVSTTGFRSVVIGNVEVTVGQTITLNAKLEVGAVTETVQVTATPGAELQTLDSTMGATIGGKDILTLPSVARDVSAMIFLQATSAPTFNGASDNITSGQVAGAFSDQNSISLDGGNNNSNLDGDNGTYVHLRGGALPMPAESVEEFRVNTNNMTAEFGSSGGGQVLVSTKRGTDAFHGSAYDFFQGDWLNSNDWYNNFHGIPKPVQHYNRFGGGIGGPALPRMLGGKTYFYMNYEGERYPRGGPSERSVPSDLLRQGIIQVRDGAGNIVQYNMKTSMQCGPAGGLACDPRGIGLNPVVGKIWNTYEPEPNDFKSGDRLNTFGYLGNLSYPLVTDFGVVRVDHDFGDKWRWFTSYRIFSQSNPDTSQVDIGGVLPGDTKGQPASASSTPYQPRYIVTGLTGTLTPSLTNDFHFNYTRNFWQWLRAGAIPYVPGIPAGVAIGGDGGALVPLNINTQAARQRLWNGHDFDFRDGLTWLKGKHYIQVGGEVLHQWFHFDRYDNVTGGLTQDKYIIQSSGLQFPTNLIPFRCPTGGSANCLPSNQVSNYESLAAQVLGVVAQNNIVATRTGTNLSLNPLGTPVASYSTVNNFNLYFNDAWKIRPNLTLNFGLNYSIQMPPFELNGAQSTLVDQNGLPITTQQYLAERQSAALLGQVYNPTLGFSPVGAVGYKYPFNPTYNDLAPRVSVAWNPTANGGWLEKLLGNKATVIRGGYGRFYTKNLGIDLVSNPVLGDGFLQTVSCVDAQMNGTCTRTSGATFANAFRLGTDGNTVPLPAIAPTLTAPVQPGVNTAFESFAAFLDSAWKPAPSDQIDISIQRELKGHWIVEAGYIGVFARNLFQGIDLNDVPYMMTVGGQRFDKAYAGVAAQVNSGAKTITPQPFFEAALKGTGYCTGYASCTAAVAANENGTISTQDVTGMWSDLDTSFNFGPALISTNQASFIYGGTTLGYSNYNAFTFSVKKRMQNLSLNSNFTYAHALGTIGLNQSYTEDNVNDPWNISRDYGPQAFDRKFVFNMLGTYTLPFGKGQRWANSNPVETRLLGGWSVSPIITIASGVPIGIFTGSFDERGNGAVGNGCTAIPNSSMSYNNGPVFNVKSDGNIGVNGDAANGGSGVNLFPNPTAVFNNFRPYILGVDGNCGGAGVLRGQLRWNVDLGITKDTAITERVGVQLYAQFFNLFNHMMWAEPSGLGGFSLQDPNNFGVLSGQYNPLSLGGNNSLANANFTRVIQLGVRFRF